MSGYRIIAAGPSRSFPDDHAILRAAGDGPAVVCIGERAGDVFQPNAEAPVVLVELGIECLGVHTGEAGGEEGSNVLGFARFRLGRGAPSDLVELVRQPNTDEAAVLAARAIFEGAGLRVALCADFAGRIIDRMIRPFFNEALNRLDQGLATASDLDTTIRLGLGYPHGPIALLHETGLAAHHDVTKALFEITGERAYAPARRAAVAKQRGED